MANMIEIKHLRKKYSRGKEVISDLNLSFGEVGLNIVCGKSGCGKTTLINILGGMDLEYDGEVIVDGLELHSSKYIDIADYRNFTSAFVFQKNSLFEFLTVEENLQLCLNIQNNESSISEALERVGLKGFEKKKVKALSGGEKQRVAIARALIKDSKVIFADEPTSALDSKNAHKIFQLFKELAKDRLVIVVTHDVKKAVLYADRLVRLVDGNVEEDTTYHERFESARVLKEKSSKKLSLLPIFKHNLKTGMIINLFVIILLIVALVITNIAIEQKKVKEEYDKFGTSEAFFNVDRAIQTQIANNVDMYKIVKNGNADSPYYYLENATSDYDNNLSDGEYSFLMNNFEKYDLYEGSNDYDYQYAFIEGISKKIRMSAEKNGIYYYWYSYEPTNFNFYTYNEDNDYDLVAGRLPEADNEILVTDTVADMYLRNRAYSPGLVYQPYYTDYVVDYNDILTDQYVVHYIEDYAESNGLSTEEDIYLDNIFTVYDVYGDYEGTLTSTQTYYCFNKKEYKVVGVINTGILPYYTYFYDTARYYLLDNFETQSGSEEYMNSMKYQPGGYIVIPNGLSGTNENQNYQDAHEITGIKCNGETLKSYIATFYGEYDYTESGLVGYEDDIATDKKGRILAKSTTETELKDDEIIISVDFAKKLYPSLNISSSNASRKFSEIANNTVEIEFYTGQTSETKTFKIVGICKNFDGDMYLSKNVFSELYVKDKGTKTTLSINLASMNLKQRKRIMEKLYKLGYSLVPEDNMPGAYLEFVTGKGEMICEVDYEGLSSLYPNHEEIIDGSYKYFYVDGLKYGYILGEYVYMSSSIIRQIALDDSYYTSQGNISPYYLYSDYYNSSNELCNTKSDTGNSLLEIIDSLYKFFLVVALVLAIGFIYLKEFRQSSSVTKLSMLGVRNKDLILLNVLTYVPMALIIGVFTLVLSGIAISILNSLYSYSFTNALMNAKLNVPLYDANNKVILIETTINRIRLMYTSSTYLTTIITTLSVMVVTLASSIFVTLRSRKGNSRRALKRAK